MRQNLLSEPLSLSILLTLVAVLAVWLSSDYSTFFIIEAWGRGLASLNSFAMQVAALIIFSSALAYTPIVQRFILLIAQQPNTDTKAYILVILLASGSSFFSGAFGLIVGALGACAIAVAMEKKDVRIDYPLLVAAAYSGFVIWHGGLAGTAPLFVSNAEHTMSDLTGGALPLQRTILSSWNLVTSAGVVSSLCIAVTFMRLKLHKETIDSAQTIVEVDANIAASFIAENLVNSGESFQHQGIGRLLSILLGASCLTYVGLKVVADATLNFQGIILICFGLGLLLAKSTSNYMELCKRGVLATLPIILLYPLYGGIMEIFATTGVVERLSASIAEHASPELLPFFTFLAAGLVNLLIPSGGGQWVLQGPVMLEAAMTLNVPPWQIVMAFSYGDQWTNLIQPFWAIPLLSICGLQINAIFKYLCVFFICSGLVFSTALFLL